MSHICPRYVADMQKNMSELCSIYMSDICLLPGERWDDLSIFKGESNISVSPTLQLNKQPFNHPNKEPIQIFSIICWTGGSGGIWSLATTIKPASQSI